MGLFFGMYLGPRKIGTGNSESKIQKQTFRFENTQQNTVRLRTLDNKYLSVNSCITKARVRARVDWLFLSGEPNTEINNRPTKLGWKKTANISKKSTK